MATEQDIRAALRSLGRRITRLDKNVRTLAMDLAKVNDKTQRAGATAGPLLLNIPVDVTLTWPKPFPDTVYGVWLELNTGTAAIGNVHATVKAGTKTTEGCTVTVTALVNVATVGIDALAVRT